MKQKSKYVWIIDRDWKGNFSPKKVLKSDADKENIKQFKTKEAANKGIGEIWIDDGYA